MTTPEMSRSGGPNFLGANHAPFVIKGYPNSPAFKVRDDAVDRFDTLLQDAAYEISGRLGHIP